MKLLVCKSGMNESFSEPMDIIAEVNIPRVTAQLADSQVIEALIGDGLIERNKYTFERNDDKSTVRGFIVDRSGTHVYYIQQD